MKLLKLVPENTSLDFLGKRWVFFAVSVLLIVGSIAMLLTKGLSFGIDFTGGSVIEIRTEKSQKISTVRALFAPHKAELGDVTLQHIGEEKDLLIRLQGTEEERITTINKAKSILEEGLGGTIDYRRVEYVGPQVGRELIKAGALSLGLACLAIMAYIWMRFEWQFSVGAIVALVHDVVITLGFFSLMGLEFNLTSIAAILTIIGYSINDTVVVYDRVRENLRKFKKMDLKELLNNSINQTLSRTVMTTGTTLIALAALILLGGEVIKGFSMSMFFGIVIGTYSSVYIASPLLIFFNLRPAKAAAPATA